MNIYLVKMTKALVRQYFSEFENDPDIFEDASQFHAYHYSDAAADAYWDRQKSRGRIHLAVMLEDEPIGEVILKHIDAQKLHCTLSIHLKRDSVKNRGFGTAAEILTLDYAFDELGMETVYADALEKNTRSRHVLEKIGFVETHKDSAFRYYRCDKASWNRPSIG